MSGCAAGFPVCTINAPTPGDHRRVISVTVAVRPVSFDSPSPQKPTLPDPNEVNGSVMADPFNMDHIKVTGILCVLTSTVEQPNTMKNGLEIHT